MQAVSEMQPYSGAERLKSVVEELEMKGVSSGSGGGSSAPDEALLRQMESLKNENSTLKAKQSSVHERLDKLIHQIESLS